MKLFNFMSCLENKLSALFFTFCACTCYQSVELEEVNCLNYF